MSLANKLTDERRNRLAAERRLELKEAEPSSANRKLGKRAEKLSEEIVETRAEVATIRGENQRVKSDLTVANQKIAIAERRLWHSIETINDGFAFFNTDNEMIMANRAYLAIFDEMEIICPGVNYVTILQVMTDEGIVNTGEMSAADWRQMMTARLELAKPEPITVHLWNNRFIRLVDQRGPDGDMVSLGIDITATVTYEEQLKAARATAESASRAKSTFLANMSHEIRTPMNGVIGMADLLNEGDLNDEQRLYVETIKNSGEALLVIINDVLDYSKIDAKRLQLHPEPFDLEHAILQVLTLLQPSADAKGLSLSLDFDLFLPNLMINDPGRIRQVLTNLIGNAVKFTAKGHVLVRVTGVPYAAADTLSLHISIEDTGIGIPADMVDQIFGEFNQVENERNRQFDGTGLGLAISQRLIETMGGKIWVTSEEGIGSCFGIQVQMGLPDRPNTLMWQPPDGLRNVMIVHANAKGRRFMERDLAQHNIKATSFCTAAEAITAIDPAPDLFIVAKAEVADLIEHLRGKNIIRPIIMLCPDLEKAGAKKEWPSPAHIRGVLNDPPLCQDLLDALTDINFALEPETAAAPSNTLRQMRVLAAEDNKTNQLVFQKMVQGFNIDLIFADNGKEAIKLFQSITPDLIFMDISMPKVDGKEATTAIRALEQGKRTPIVALTAHAMDGDDREILAAGLDRYLTKPLRKALIAQEIEAAHGAGMEPLFLPQADG